MLDELNEHTRFLTFGVIPGKMSELRHNELVSLMPFAPRVPESASSNYPKSAARYRGRPGAA